MQLVLLSPPVLLSLPFAGAAHKASSRVRWALPSPPPRSLESGCRACRLVVPQPSLPRSWATGLKARAAHAVGCRGVGAGDGTRLRSTEEQRHKPLCFGSPGQRRPCLAAALSSGVLCIKWSSCFFRNSPTLVGCGAVTGVPGRSVCCPTVDALCSAQVESAVRQ